MTAEDIPRFAACTAEAYRGYPLFDHLFGPAYNPSAVETIFGASMRCSRGLLGVSDTAAADAVALFLPPGARVHPPPGSSRTEAWDSSSPPVSAP